VKVQRATRKGSKSRSLATPVVCDQKCSNCKIVPEEFLHLMAKYCTHYHLANL